MQAEQRGSARRGQSASPLRQQLYNHARARSQLPYGASAAAAASSLSSSSPPRRQQQQQQQQQHNTDDFLECAEPRIHSGDNNNSSSSSRRVASPTRTRQDGYGYVVHDVYARCRFAAGIRAATVVRARNTNKSTKDGNDSSSSNSGDVVWTAEVDGALCVRSLPRGAVRKRLPGREGTYATCLLYVNVDNRSGNDNDNDNDDGATNESGTHNAQNNNNSSSSDSAGANNGGCVWVGMNDGYMRIYDARTAQLLREQVHHCGAVYNMLELEGVVYTAAQDWKVHQWRARDGGYLRLFAGHSGSVRCLAAYTGPTGAVLFSGSDDGTVRAWNPYTPRVPATTSPASAAALRAAACLHTFVAPSVAAAAATTAAGDNDDKDAPQPSPLLSSPQPHHNDNKSSKTGNSSGNGGCGVAACDGVRSLLVVRDVNQLWSGTEGGVVRVWDMATLRCILERTTTTHTTTAAAPVTCLRRIATRVWSADAHGRVLLWDVQTLTPLQDIAAPMQPQSALKQSPPQQQQQQQRAAVWSLLAVQPYTAWRVWVAMANGVVQCYHAETTPLVTRTRAQRHTTTTTMTTTSAGAQQEDEEDDDDVMDNEDDGKDSEKMAATSLTQSLSSRTLHAAPAPPPPSPTTTTTTAHDTEAAVLSALPASARAYVHALRSERDVARREAARLREHAHEAAVQHATALHAMHTELEQLRAQLAQQQQRQQEEEQQRRQRQHSTATASTPPSSSSAVVASSSLLLPAESATAETATRTTTGAPPPPPRAEAAPASSGVLHNNEDDAADALLLLQLQSNARAQNVLRSARAELARMQHSLDDEKNDDDDDVRTTRQRGNGNNTTEDKKKAASGTDMLVDDVVAAEAAAAQLRAQHAALEQHVRTRLQPQLSSLQRIHAATQLLLQQSERRCATLQAKYDELQRRQQRQQ